MLRATAIDRPLLIDLHTATNREGLVYGCGGRRLPQMEATH